MQTYWCCVMNFFVASFQPSGHFLCVLPAYDVHDMEEFVICFTLTQCKTASRNMVQVVSA